MAKLLTVFTPTYNRAYCLHHGYEALQRQTCKDFVWLIIDDGSTDDTKTLVSKWQSECSDFEIRYIYKENGGLYTGYNTAIAAADTELMVCVDSDDWLTDNAVELITSFWKENGSQDYAGILGLDCTVEGKIIGDQLPEQKNINLIDILIGKYNFVNGDRKNVVRTELYKSVAPMKEYPGERDFNPHFLHLQISKQYDFLILNERLCVVDYQPDGMTNSVFKAYLRSPKSFRAMRLFDMSLEGIPLKYLLRTNIHYTSSCILSGEPCISASPHKLATICMWPFGLLLAVYLKMKTKE